MKIQIKESVLCFYYKNYFFCVTPVHPLFPPTAPRVGGNAFKAAVKTIMQSYANVRHCHTARLLNTGKEEPQEWEKVGK